MSWRRIAFKNTLKTSHRYLGFLSSASVSVLVYFMFACFTANPAVKQGYMADSARGIFIGCQYVIVVFAIFFVVFFHSALLRLRSKEFGLFSVIGVTPAQIRSIVFVESLVFGAASLVIGGFLGALLTKLFLMVMAAILQLPDAIPFIVPHQAVWNTLTIFGVVFVVDALFNAIRVSGATPRDLLLGARVKQKMPKFSVTLVVISFACIGCSYYLAVFQSRNAVMTFLPILVLVSVGTYWLFSQSAVLLVQSLRKRPLEGKTMLVVGRLAYRLKDNARVLTVVTVLSAAVLSGMGAVVGLDAITDTNSLRVSPVSAMLTLPAGYPNVSITPDSLRKTIAENHMTISKQVTTPLLVASGQTQNGVGTRNMDYTMTVVSESQFNRLRMALIENEPSVQHYLPKPPSVQPGHADLFIPYPLVVRFRTQGTKSTVNFKGANNESVFIDGTFDTRLLNEQSNRLLPDNCLLVSDADYATWTRLAPVASQWTVYSYLTPNWLDLKSVANHYIIANSDGAQSVSFTVTAVIQAKRMLSTMIFAGFFVSILFFLACGSAIYFRLQAQREDDSRQFQSLRRLGMRSKEMKGVLTVELLTLFTLPVLMAIVHSIFAMADFANMLDMHQVAGNIWPIFASVAGLYTASMALYFLVARVRHARAVVE